MRVVKAFVVALMLAAALAPRASAQNQDLAGSLFPFQAIGARIHLTTADTSAKIDRAGYAGATYVINAGHSVNAAGTPVYAVLQDSGALNSWTAVDSVSTDTVDNSVYKGKSYKGANRYLRVIVRAASTNDTTFLSATVFLSGKRSR